MHLSDGVVGLPLTVAGGAVALGMCGLAARRIHDEEIPRIALFTSAFFVASLIHFPIGPTSVHLIFNGLVGVMLGFRAFLVFPVGLTLQALLLGHGGVSAIGINTCLFGFPAWACYGVHYWLQRSGRIPVFIDGLLSGGLAVILSGILLAMILLTLGEAFKLVVEYTLLAHLPIALIEGTITGFCLRYLTIGRPEMLQGIQS